MELQFGKTYIMIEDEMNAATGTVYIKKGSRVKVSTIGESRVLVKDLSAEVLADGVWSVEKRKLVTPEKYEEMLMAGEIDVEPEPPELEEGAIYVMKRAEVSGDGRVTYLKKGARVRIESFGRVSVLVQDLSDDKIDDGVWMTQASALMPLEDALIVGHTYYMAEAEKNSRGDVTFIQKGAIVRLEVWGQDRVVVQDLSEAKRGDGCWYTDPIKLVPIDKPVHNDAEVEASDKNKRCVMVEESAAELEKENKESVVDFYIRGGSELEQKNKHYVSEHQPIESMQANMTTEELVGFLKGNIIKYACRCGRKDEPLKEAEKIKQYADWLCVVLSGGTIDPRL